MKLSGNTLFLTFAFPVLYVFFSILSKLLKKNENHVLAASVPHPPISHLFLLIFLLISFLYFVQISSSDTAQPLTSSPLQAAAEKSKAEVYWVFCCNSCQVI